jgi:hypothetical protein
MPLVDCRALVICLLCSTKQRPYHSCIARFTMFLGQLPHDDVFSVRQAFPSNVFTSSEK